MREQKCESSLQLYANISIFSVPTLHLICVSGVGVYNGPQNVYTQLLQKDRVMSTVQSQA